MDTYTDRCTADVTMGVSMPMLLLLLLYVGVGISLVN